MSNFSRKFKFAINSVVGLFFPDYCPGCGEPLNTGEHYICTKCISNLPYTYFNNSRKNVVSELLLGRINRFEKAYSLCYFIKKSNLQKLLHNLKYENKPDIGNELGIYLGQALKQNELFDFDLIVPVPLHPKKEKIRGYNQSEKIAQGISKIIDKPIDSKSISRIVFTQTQTKKSKDERWENVKNIFIIKKPKNLENKHILIVDDVITTGATIESMSYQLEKIPGIKISVASIAIAKKF